MRAFHRLVLFLLAAIAPVSADDREVGAEHEVVAKIASLRNTDVTWSGSPIGLVPFLSPRADKILTSGPGVRPALRELLKRDDSFVVAHVMLTFLSPEPAPFSADKWNDLDVVLLPGGHGYVDPNQRIRIMMMWEKKAAQPGATDNPDGAQRLREDH